MSAFAADPDYLTETRRHPAAVGGWVQAAAAGLRAGVVALALKAARRSVLLDPSAPAAAALLTAASTAEPLVSRHRATALWAILHPGKAEALGALASSYQDLGRAEQAERVARDALHADPYLDWVRVNLAVILRESGREGKAETELRRAVIAGPDGNLAWRRMAALAETLSKLERAGTAARRALVIDAQDHVSALFLSIVERRQGDLDGALHRLQALPEAMDGEAGRDAVEFELGTVLDRLGQYDEAWTRFERGNRIAVQRAPSGAADPRPFLSTLDAFAGAISDGWPARWARLPEASPPAVFMAERLAALDEDEADRLRAEYRAKLVRWAGDKSPRVVIDKMPLNIIYLPLALRLYPNAKVILSLRHPCDCCLSCFMQSIRLNSAMASFTSMEGAAGFYARVMALWQEIERVLSPDHITVRYEDLVADTEGVARRVVDFLGLDWTDAVLDHTAHAKARGMIRTPSFRQVSEPIYTRAVGRWSRYRDQMAPYLDTLAPYAGYFGYGDPRDIPRGED